MNMSAEAQASSSSPTSTLNQPDPSLPVTASTLDVADEKQSIIREARETIDNKSDTRRQPLSSSSPSPPAQISGQDGLPDWSQYTLPRRPWRPKVTPFSRIVQAKYRGSGTPEDPFIVAWLDDDAENPKMYSNWRKWLITFLVSVACLCVSLSSSGYTGAARLIMGAFDCSEEVFLLGLALMVLGFALGPLVWGPLSEALGRRHVFVGTLFFYTVWTAVCAAAQNIHTLIIFRLFCGTIGSSAFVVPSGQVADMFEAKQRGVAMAIYAATPFMGPTLGPLVGGFLGEAAGWRWLMGFFALFGVVVTLVMYAVMPETYAPVLLRQRAKLLSKVTGRCYLTKIDHEHPPVMRQVIKRSLSRPWALLFREPIVLLLTIYMAVIYGTLYLCFAAFPIVFQQGYGWNPGQGGLAFLGITVGTLIGVGIIIFDNRRYTRIHNATGGFAPPETRLPPAMAGGVFAIVGLAWFAATASPSIHFIVPILAGVPFGMGFITIFMSCSNYLVDSYTIYSASVMAANSILRSTFGAVFPLFTIYMYEDLGVHWASAVPGFIALACFPFPIFFYRYGARIRRRCKYSAEAARLMDSLRSDLERARSTGDEGPAELDAGGEKAGEGDGQGQTGRGVLTVHLA